MTTRMLTKDALFESRYKLDLFLSTAFKHSEQLEWPNRHRRPQFNYIWTEYLI